MNTAVIGPDGVRRCSWCLANELYIRYHDEEWGVPENDNQRLFEKMSLESFQSGLSWLTILQKRANFRQAFANFDYRQVATFNESDIQRLLADKGIVRHRGKIEATINNAKCVSLIIQEHGSLAKFFTAFKPYTKTDSTLATKTTESAALAKALKQYGWKFFGPTTAYALMQAIGLVNDHALDCEFK